MPERSTCVVPTTSLTLAPPVFVTVHVYMRIWPEFTGSGLSATDTVIGVAASAVLPRYPGIESRSANTTTRTFATRLRIVFPSTLAREKWAHGGARRSQVSKLNDG